jgi:putative peptidoglycan lipid II flippase
MKTDLPSLPTEQIATANAGILRAALAVGMAGVLVKLIALLKEIFVAAAFGRSDVMDAFLAAILIPSLLVNLIAESMNQALVPTLIRIREQEGQASAQRLFSSSMLWLCCLLAGVSLLVAALAHSFFPVIAWNYSPAKLQLAEHLFYALLPIVFLSGIASNCTAVLNSVDRFVLPALAPAVISITIIAGVTAEAARYGIAALVAATVLGTLLHALCMAGLMHVHGYRFSLRWYGSTAAVREVGSQYGPVFLSGVVASGGLLVDQSMAASLPAGSVSALAYASRYAGMVLTLMAGAISTAVVPTFSRMIAHGDWAGFRATSRYWVQMTLTISVPIALALIFGARFLVGVTLQHGAFGPSDTTVVTQVLAMYALQIPFYVSSRVYYRAIVALRRTDIVFYGGLLNLLLDVVLNLVLMRWFGVAGIALATSLWTMSTFLFLRYWAKRLIAEGERASLQNA